MIEIKRVAWAAAAAVVVASAVACAMRPEGRAAREIAAQRWDCSGAFCK